MADDRSELVSQVTERVMKEMLEQETAFEKAYGVGDLKAHLAGLGKGIETAWEISYKTSSALAVEQLGDIGKGPRNSQIAWEISYKTSMAPNIEQAKSR